MPAVAVLDPALRALVARTLPAGLAELVPPDRRPGLVVLGPAPRPFSPVPGGTVLLPGRAWRGALPAAAAVGYGPSPRDTLTFSSLGEGKLLLSLQREVVALTGRRLDRQELPLPLLGCPMTTLAWAGTLLLAGAEPESLAALAGRGV